MDQAIFCRRRRAKPRRLLQAATKPGSSAPTIGAGTGTVAPTLPVHGSEWLEQPLVPAASARSATKAMVPLFDWVVPRAKFVPLILNSIEEPHKVGPDPVHASWDKNVPKPACALKEPPLNENVWAAGALSETRVNVFA